MPPITRDLARCGNESCRRWASVWGDTALPIGSRVELTPDGWVAHIPADSELPSEPAACGGCGAPMVLVDQAAHYASLPVSQNDPVDLAELARQSAAKGKT